MLLLGNNAFFFETTAQNYDNIMEAIRKLVNEYIIKYGDINDKKDKIVLNDENNKNNGCCGKKK